jgi:hypothetical protein
MGALNVRDANREGSLTQVEDREMKNGNGRKNDPGNLTAVVKRAPAQFVKKEFDQLVERIEAEGQRFGAALGFPPGAPMLRAVQRELQFWRAGRLDYHEWGDDSHDETYFRLACLEGLDVLLQPRLQMNGSSEKGWIEMFDEYHALLRRYALKAGPAPAADDVEEWLQSKRKCTAYQISELRKNSRKRRAL